MNGSLSLILLFVFPLILSAQDQAFESKMNRIYKNSYSTEISDQLWSEYVSSLRTRSYEVTEGDTLWGLSEVFFGDGFFWSKIWSYNASLTNPHFLKVGQEISFFTGSINEPPSLSVNGDSFISQEEINLPQGFKSTDIVEEVKEGDSGVALKSERVSGLYPGAPHIPPPQSDIRPVLKVIPSAFEDSNDSYGKKYNDKGISLDIRPPIQVNPLFVAYSFLYGAKEETYPRVGEVIESENGNTLVGLNDQIYIQSKEELKQGEIFTIMGTDFIFDRNGIYGSVIRYTARAQIIQKLDNERYLGEVVQSFSGIKPGAWISRETIPTFNDDHSGRANSLVLKIIGGGSDNVSRIYGQSDVVYLAGGANKGLRVGDVLGVYKVRDLRVADSKVRISPSPIAHIKVFRAEPKLSSAFVITSKEAILPGDETGSPTVVIEKMTQSEKDDLNRVETSLDFDSEFKTQ